jgi:hypothetical protein
MLEARLLHPRRRLRGIREKRWIRQVSVPKTVIQWQLHPPNPRNQLNPRQKKPQNDPKHPNPEPATDEKKQTETRNQKRQRTELPQPIRP